jgi:hypothetical protein
VRLTLLFCAAAALVHAQSANPAAGLEPAWDIAVILNEISGNATRLMPELDKLKPRSWVEKGASETYVEQWQSSRDQARAVGDGAKALARNPERLSASLELFFRLEGLERMIRSIEEGARKYQGAEFAQGVDVVYAEGGTNRERFRRYIVNLAAEREQQFEVMDKEAQRCRATLMAPAPPNPAGRKK